jgi:hypothetical protein
MWLAMVKQRRETYHEKFWLLLAMVTPLHLIHAHEVKCRLVDFSFVSACAPYGKNSGTR